MKFKMDVSDVTVVDRPDCLTRSMIIKPTGKRVEEHIYASEHEGEMIYRLVDADDERVIAVKEGPLRMEFCQCHVSDGFRMLWKLPVDSVKQMLQETVGFEASNDSKGGDAGLRVWSDEIKGVSHDALGRSMKLSIRESARSYPCSGVSIRGCSGYGDLLSGVHGDESNMHTAIFILEHIAEHAVIEGIAHLLHAVTDAESKSII